MQDTGSSFFYSHSPLLAVLAVAAILVLLFWRYQTAADNFTQTSANKARETLEQYMSELQEAMHNMLLRYNEINKPQKVKETIQIIIEPRETEPSQSKKFR